MNPGRQILVVEDDQVSRSFLECALTKQGYAVTTAEDATEAQEQLAPAALGTFDCVVTDYRMPGGNGLELLAWIKARDPGLATILVTAEGEKHLVAESLRGGAVDFLDKPIDLAKLRTAVAQAVQRTLRQRNLTESESAVRELGRAQERMLGVDDFTGPVRVDVCFHPKHEAGGDFFSRFRPAPGQLVCLLTDVSGHDPQAAYLSAYCHGVVRGMIERAAPVAEIFAVFNRFLLEEWQHPGAGGRQPAVIEASVAACAIALNFSANSATVLTQGNPAPVYWSPDGDARVIGELSGFPLGWFPDLLVRDVVQTLSGGDSFCLWTDGLEALAAKQGVSALSLACALQRAKARHERLAELAAAADDILVADLHLSSEPATTAPFRPLILEQYHGGQAGEIDEIQAFWWRSLTLAAPELPEDRLHDVLLASREALLNALHHGCGGRAGQSATYQAAYSTASQTLRVRVSDPGPGHHFDLARHERRAGRELVENQRGLILIKHLASTVDFARNGASVVLDFAGAPPGSNG